MKSTAEIDEVIEFQRGEWRFQRIAWLVLAVIVVLGLLGILGSGPLSHASKSDPRGLLSIDYERFIRLQSPTAIKIKLKPPAQGSGEIRFWIASDALEAIETSELIPSPDAVESQGDRVVYYYPVKSEKPNLFVTLHFHPVQIGRLPWRLGYSDGTEVEFIQFIHP